MFHVMKNGRFGLLVAAILGLVFAPIAMADDKEDVLEFIHEYGELEGDLDAQAKMIRDDRVMITTVRQTDAMKNMTIQKANREANDALAGGKSKWVTSIESPHIQVYGDVAVASFVRSFNIYPHNQAPIAGSPQWVTLVLVKEGRDWGIAHTHMSSTAPAN